MYQTNTSQLLVNISTISNFAKNKVQTKVPLLFFLSFMIGGERKKKSQSGVHKLKWNAFFHNHFQTSGLTECDVRRWDFHLFVSSSKSQPANYRWLLCEEKKKERNLRPLHPDHSRQRLNWDETHQRGKCMQKIIVVPFFQGNNV